MKLENKHYYMIGGALIAIIVIYSVIKKNKSAKKTENVQNNAPSPSLFPQGD